MPTNHEGRSAGGHGLTSCWSRHRQELRKRPIRVPYAVQYLIYLSNKFGPTYVADDRESWNFCTRSLRYCRLKQHAPSWTDSGTRKVLLPARFGQTNTSHFPYVIWSGIDSEPHVSSICGWRDARDGMPKPATKFVSKSACTGSQTGARQSFWSGIHQTLVTKWAVNPLISPKTIDSLLRQPVGFRFLHGVLSNQKHIIREKLYGANTTQTGFCNLSYTDAHRAMSKQRLWRSSINLSGLQIFVRRCNICPLDTLAGVGCCLRLKKARSNYVKVPVLYDLSYLLSFERFPEAGCWRWWILMSPAESLDTPTRSWSIEALPSSKKTAQSWMRPLLLTRESRCIVPAEWTKKLNLTLHVLIGTKMCKEHLHDNVSRRIVRHEPIGGSFCSNGKVSSIKVQTSLCTESCAAGWKTVSTNLVWNVNTYSRMWGSNSLMSGKLALCSCLGP